MDTEFKQLRERAKKLLKREKLLQNNNSYKDKDISTLLEELYVRQIELELQNEELQTSQKNEKKEQQKYKNLYEFAPIPYFTFNKTGNILELNEKAAQLLGAPKNQFYKNSIFPFIANDEEKIKFKKHLNKLFKNQEATTTDLTIVSKNGNQYFVKIQSIYMPEHQQQLCQTTITDITPEKEKQQKEIEAQYNYLNTVFNQIPTLIAYLDVNFNFIKVNNAYARSFKRKPDYFSDKNYFELFHDKKLFDIFNRVIDTGKSYMGATEALKNYSEFSKKTRYYNWSVIPVKSNLDKVNAFIFNLLDVTDKVEQQEKLITSEKKFKTIFNNAPLGIFRSTVEGKFIELNQALALMLGYSSPNEVLQSIYNISEQIYVTTNKRNKIVNQTLHAEQVTHYENVYRRRNGEHFIANLYLRSIKDLQGNTLFLEGMVEDITEQKKIEQDLIQSEEKYRSLVNTMNDGVLFQDIENNVITCNLAAKKILGLSDENIKNNRIINPQWQLINEDETALNSKLFPINQVIKNGKAIYNSIIGIKKQDTPTKWVHINAAPIFHETQNILLAVVASITDITKLKNTENKLRKLIKAKDKFFSILAHDLRNPFNTIFISAEMLLNKKEDISKKSTHLFINSIYKSAKHTLQLIEDLLVWGRAQTGTLKCQPTKLFINKLIDDNILTLADTAKPKKISLKKKINGLITAYADENMITTVIRNLVSNAIKFTYSGGNITIGAYHENDKVIVFVEDTGIGIKQEDSKKLFQIASDFIRPGTNSEQGTGLGLALCKEFVEKNNGKIWCKSQEKKGSTFYFTLPLSQ